MDYLYRTEDGEEFTVTFPPFSPVPFVTLEDGRLAQRVYTNPAILHKGTGWGDPSDGDRQTDFQRTYLDDDSGKVGPHGERY